MLLQGMEGGWVVIEASHTMRSGLNVTCHMLTGAISSWMRMPNKCCMSQMILQAPSPVWTDSLSLPEVCQPAHVHQVTIEL